ncbi:MAG: hypothetical protein Q8S27_10135 [Hoeflea sp.]|uniref:hypothetical protein n=1 Tax=Hoeflea sp. TaxID=1940281 RepID=UPI002730DFBA|nr:hypothetical protein [Hoeflea sp.]MDP2120978.1 hypothetical protein [Hoeflea sp.]MDP3524928.1 hypothetical protein [Hoeflea sp.]
MRQSLMIVASLMAAMAPAAASSGDAWADFAETVRTQCLEAAAPVLEAAEIVVDPFGSESFGLAVLSGKARGAEATVSYICVMDKQSGAVELGSELPAEILSVDVP